MFRIILTLLVIGMSLITLRSCSLPPQTPLLCFPDTDTFKKVPPAPEAVSFIKLITNIMGVSDHMNIYGAEYTEGSPIAFAGVCGGQRWLIYDVDSFMYFEAGKTSWDSVGVIAHEIGHHLNSVVFDAGKGVQQSESESDYFAGFVIARMGGIRSDAYSFTNHLSEEGDEAHPPRIERKMLAIAGWKAAQAHKEREMMQCYGHDWHGEAFYLRSKECRVVNICSGGKVVPRIACHKTGKTWVIQG